MGMLQRQWLSLELLLVLCLLSADVSSRSLSAGVNGAKSITDQHSEVAASSMPQLAAVLNDENHSGVYYESPSDVDDSSSNSKYEPLTSADYVNISQFKSANLSQSGDYPGRVFSFVSQISLLSIAKQWWFSSNQQESFIYQEPQKNEKNQSTQVPLNGFRFCQHLNGAVFDSEAPLYKSIMEAIYQVAPLEKDYDQILDQLRSTPLLFRLKLNKKIEKMFSPLVDLQSPLVVIQDESYQTTDRIGFDMNGITSLKEFGVEKAVQVIDTAAIALYQTLLQRQYGLSEQEIRASFTRISSQQQLSQNQSASDRSSPFMKSSHDAFYSSLRFACFQAADGNNPHLKYVASEQFRYNDADSNPLKIKSASPLIVGDRKFMRYIDPRVYFDGSINYAPLNLDLVQYEADALAFDWRQKYVNDVYSDEDLFISHERQDSKFDAALSSSTSSDTSTNKDQQQQQQQQPARNGQIGKRYRRDDLSQFDPMASLSSHSSATAATTEQKVFKLEQFSLQQLSKVADKIRQRDIKAFDRPHKLAYFVLVHKGFTNFVKLLESIIDKHAVILIHVDAKNPVLKGQIVKYVEQQMSQNPSLYAKTKVMKRSFYGMWGQSSLVFAQLAGFFELLEMDSEWDYVINLSANDLMLRSNDVIYDDLVSDCLARNQSIRQCSFMGYWSSIDAIARVYDAPMLAPQSTVVHYNMKTAILDDEDVTENERIITNNVQSKGLPQNVVDTMAQVLQIPVSPGSQRIAFPYSHWSLYKHHQWVVLGRDVVRHLQYSPTASYVAAFMEFGFIVDEIYLATVLANSVGFIKKSLPIQSQAQSNSNVNRRPYAGVGELINDSKRFIEFPLASKHPRKIMLPDLKLMASLVFNQRIFDARKVDFGHAADSYMLSELLPASYGSKDYKSQFPYARWIFDATLYQDDDVIKQMQQYKKLLSSHKVDFDKVYPLLKSIADFKLIDWVNTYYPRLLLRIMNDQGGSQQTLN
ncbi:hypothetical protein MP228_000296 [Amoeboaphelidium protococcarum]|nr:hypothetical protein MP228_000296 [Amoeboaphelidium protococcarum]